MALMALFVVWICAGSISAAEKGVEGDTESLKTGSESAYRQVPEDAEAYVNLPERIGARDLARQLLDLPGSLQVVDIRPPWQYEEFHIPGSSNAPVSAVLNDPSFLTGKRPLVIVCRDGSISAAVAGAIFSRTQRPVKYLSGGVTGYWDELMIPPGVLSESGMGTGGITPKAPSEQETPPPPEPGSVPVPSREEKKQFDAGC